MQGPIVVGVDGTPAAEQAVAQAVGIAAATGSSLHLVAVCPNHGRETDQEVQDSVRGFEEALAAAGRAAEEAGLTRFDSQLRHGDPAESIVALATEVKADLIVLGGGRIGSIVRFLLGSVADKISHHTPCSVMIAAAPR